MRNLLARLLAVLVLAATSVADANVTVAVKNGGLVIKGDDAGKGTDTVTVP